MFNINDKVVFIGWPDDIPEDYNEDTSDDKATDLIEGRVYVVRGIDPPNGTDPDVGLYLVGECAGYSIDDPNFETSWWDGMFRKLSEVQAENRAARKDKHPH